MIKMIVVAVALIMTILNLIDLWNEEDPKMRLLILRDIFIEYLLILLVLKYL